jgi:hypothetical protein
VNKKITGSCVWRQKFDNLADEEYHRKNRGKKLKGLIAGYGILWNIKYQS